KGNYYDAWDHDEYFKQDGTGPSTPFGSTTTGKAGIFFYDTRDGTPPRGLYTDTWPTTNLTPDIAISSSDNFAGIEGFGYLNSSMYRTTGSGSIGSTHTVFPPGEPFDGSGFVNLQYPGDFSNNYIVRETSVAGGSFV